MKRILCALLLCILLISAALAEPIQLSSLDQLPEAGENGFLPEGQTAVYYKNHKEGHWLYFSATERIEITRHQSTSPKMTWYIADIRLLPGTGMMVKSASPERPGRSNATPHIIANREHVVFALDGDFYTARVQEKHNPGHIVRNGKVLYSKGLSKMYYRLPNLATMAFYADGRAEVNQSWEKTAEEYVADGARDVVSFGPVLIRNGEIEDINKEAFTYHEPRSCIGMVEPSHYVGLLVEGRKDHSRGATILECAQLLKEQGCTIALNLDGGGSSCMLFMGEAVQLNNYGRVDNSCRKMPDIICAGIY